MTGNQSWEDYFAASAPTGASIPGTDAGTGTGSWEDYFNQNTPMDRLREESFPLTAALHGLTLGAVPGLWGALPTAQARYNALSAASPRESAIFTGVGDLANNVAAWALTPELKLPAALGELAVKYGSPVVNALIKGAGLGAANTPVTGGNPLTNAGVGGIAGGLTAGASGGLIATTNALAPELASTLAKYGLTATGNSAEDIAAAKSANQKLFTGLMARPMSFSSSADISLDPVLSGTLSAIRSANFAGTGAGPRVEKLFTSLIGDADEPFSAINPKTYASAVAPGGQLDALLKSKNPTISSAAQQIKFAIDNAVSRQGVKLASDFATNASERETLNALTPHRPFSFNPLTGGVAGGVAALGGEELLSHANEIVEALHAGHPLALAGAGAAALGAARYIVPRTAWWQNAQIARALGLPIGAPSVLTPGAGFGATALFNQFGQ